MLYYCCGGNVMFKLLSSNDAKFMAKANFVKNAVFYKDMLAFYDAFEKITSAPKESLPNYCLFSNGDYCLEGLCLVMKIYQSEFGFESIRLSQDYLKVLYYCICGYSQDGKTVSKDFIFAERSEYYDASKQLESSLVGEFEVVETSTNEINEKMRRAKEKIQFSGKSASLSRFLYVFFFVFAFFTAMLPFTFYYLGKFKMIYAFLISSAVLVAGLMLFFFFKMLNKHFIEKKNDTSYSLQSLKKKGEDLNRKFIRSKDGLSRLVCEKYEYEHNSAEDLKKYFKQLSVDEVIKKAGEYNLLTYNQLLDINRLFETQAREEEEVVELITISNDFSELYKKIKENDWLYYNSNVRYHFIAKFIENAKNTHAWAIDLNGKEVLPFDVDVKKIATEKVVYLENMDKPFISASFDIIEKTSFVKKLNAQQDYGKMSIDDERQLKSSLITHFYNFDELKKYDNLFADKRMDKSAKVTNEIISGKQHIPVSLMIKLKIAESDLGYENYNSNAIKQIADNILKISKTQLKTLSAKEINSVISTYPTSVFVSEVDEIEELSDCVKYVIGGREFIGYKLIV